MIKCIIFDFGDTLVNTKRKTIEAHMVEYARFLNKHGFYFSSDKVIAAHKATEKTWSSFDEKSKQIRRLWEKTFLKALGVNPTNKLCFAMEKAYYYFRIKNDKLMPNTIKTLKKLKKQGIRLCVVTNTKTNTNYVLAKEFKILQYFDYFLRSHKEGTIKSELKIFHLLLEKLNKNRKNKILPSECLMVGNNLNEDTAASQIGMKTVILKKYIYVNKTKAFFEPDYYIDDLIEIVNIVAELTAGES
ncbi:MAG: HAD-IA family hydrolase [archaeon]